MKMISSIYSPIVSQYIYIHDVNANAVLYHHSPLSWALLMPAKTDCYSCTKDSISREDWKLSYSFVVFVIGVFLLLVHSSRSSALQRALRRARLNSSLRQSQPQPTFWFFLPMTTKEVVDDEATEELTLLRGCGELYKFGDWRAWIETLFYIYILFIFLASRVSFSFSHFYNEQYLPSYMMWCVEKIEFFLLLPDIKEYLNK